MKIEQIACMNMNFHYYPFTYFLDAAVELGIHRIELWGGAPHLWFEDMDPGERLQVKQEINARELQLVSYTPEALFYPYNVAAEHETMRKRSIRFLQDNIRFAAELGTKQVLLIAGRGYYNKPAEEAWDRAMDSFSQLLPVAEKEDITLMLEALQPTESNIVTTTSEVKRVLDTFASPYLKTMIDTVQMTVAGETIDQYFDAFGKDIMHVHLTEGAPSGHVTWGDGNLPLKDFLRDFEKHGYDRTLSLEIGGYETDPVDALRRGFNRVREAM